MRKITLLTYLLTVISVQLSRAQEPIHYLNCNCDETPTYSTNNKEKLDGPYQLTCDNIQIEDGQYENGSKSGLWTTKSKKGTVIRTAEYLNGNINGKYELFYFNGSPKLKASFANGQPDGPWQYYNEKGKPIKVGSYKAGKPIGIWTIYDKNGKKPIAAYDFDKEGSNPVAEPYYKNGGIQRDDQSGEHYIIYYPERSPQSDSQPLGGYALSCDFFLKLFSIPTLMMDTYTNYNFIVSLQIENNIVRTTNIAIVDKVTYNPNKPSFPFIVSTNPPAKLWRMEHSGHSIDLLKDRILETINVMGPWIGNSKIDIYVPFVLNDIKRF